MRRQQSWRKARSAVAAPEDAAPPMPMRRQQVHQKAQRQPSERNGQYTAMAKARRAARAATRRHGRVVPCAAVSAKCSGRTGRRPRRRECWRCCSSERRASRVRNQRVVLAGRCVCDAMSRPREKYPSFQQNDSGAAQVCAHTHVKGRRRWVEINSQKASRVCQQALPFAHAYSGSSPRQALRGAYFTPSHALPRPF